MNAIVCENCQSTFSTKQALQYHVKRMVCKKTEANLQFDSAKQLLEMVEKLSNRLSALEVEVNVLKTENKELKEAMKTHKSTPSKKEEVNEKTEEEKKEECYKRLVANFVKKDKETGKLILDDNGERYALSKVKDKYVVCARIFPDGKYSKLTENDNKALQSLFKNVGASFAIYNNYESFIVQAGINLKGDRVIIEEDDEEEDEEDEDVEYDEKEETTIVPPLAPTIVACPAHREFFTKHEDGRRYFMGTRATNVILSEYKLIFNDVCKKDEAKFKKHLESAPSSVESAWKSNRTDMLDYFNQP